MELTLLPLEAMSLPEAHVNFGPGLGLLEHRGFHSDQVSAAGANEGETTDESACIHQ